MAAPIRERLPLPVGDGRDVLGRKGAEQDEDQVTAAGAMLSAELRQAECGLISGAAAMPADSTDLRPAWPEAPVPSAADALYDARRGVYYTKPVLRGWLHVLWFEASLVLGPLLVARAHGATRITAGGIHLAWMSAPELLVGATFVGLGWAAGLALPEVWIHAGVTPGVLMLAGGLLYTAGALCYHRRRPDPSPSVFGYHEVFHACVCAAAACQYLAIARFIA